MTTGWVKWGAQLAKLSLRKSSPDSAGSNGRVPGGVPAVPDALCAASKLAIILAAQFWFTITFRIRSLYLIDPEQRPMRANRSWDVKVSNSKGTLNVKNFVQ